MSAPALRRGLPTPAVPSGPSRPTELLAGWARRLTSAPRLRLLLAAAGKDRPGALERVLAGKLALAAAGGTVGLVGSVATGGPAWLVGAVLLGAGAWRLPDVLLGGRAGERREAIRRALPDTLDQLTIAVEAGLGFEAATARVAAGGRGPLAEELRHMLQDVQVGVGRGDALTLLAERTGVPEVRRLVASMRQSERYGVPIAAVLRTQAAELRDRSRQRAEERAMKLPVKVVFPLVCCILPTLFIVVLGPAVLHYRSAGGLGG